MSRDVYFIELLRDIRKAQGMVSPGNLLSNATMRIGEEFDPFIYLDILTHLSLLEGYVLDFTYDYQEGLGGHPCLYARPLENAPFETMTELEAWERKNNVSDFLVSDGTPESFFELVVFREVANQFYLYWHNAYNDLRIITEKTDIFKIVTTLDELGPVKFDPVQAEIAMALDPVPRIELTETSASVVYCTFTQWGGFSIQQEVFSRVHPHLLLCSEVLKTAKYNCGVIF